MDKYNAIGLMSGTSLDGIDIAACEFLQSASKWSFKILRGQTYPYSPEWKSKLAGLASTDALTFSHTNVEYGHLLGSLTRIFLDEMGFKADFIASHGHTIFHQPENGFTVQIGSGSAIAAETGLPVICDFRSVDVALGGQGAPLVPVGDRLLFSEFDACLNLGGFANISMEFNGQRIAFDICPVNIVLNLLAARLAFDFDKDGLIARSGNVNNELLEQLDSLNYYNLMWPKSLGREWLEAEFLPLLDRYSGSVENQLCTVCEHIARQVNQSAPPGDDSIVLMTGGGVHNHFLLERIREISSRNWIVPQNELIDYKEALVFAFLGVLRWRNEPNVLRSVTGSRINHAGGAIYHPV